jgi:hypothetical protein
MAGEPDALILHVRDWAGALDNRRSCRQTILSSNMQGIPKGLLFIKSAIFIDQV